MARTGRPPMTTPEQDRRAAAMAADGVSWKDIGEELGVSDKTAKLAAERGARGGRTDESQELQELQELLERGWAKLTPTELSALKARLAGKTLAVIGVALGCSKQRVAQIVARAKQKLRA